MLISDFNHRERGVHEDEEEQEDDYVADNEEVFAEDACAEGGYHVPVGVVDEKEVGAEELVNRIYHNEHTGENCKNLRKHPDFRLEAAGKEHDWVAHKEYM